MYARLWKKTKDKMREQEWLMVYYSNLTSHFQEFLNIVFIVIKGHQSIQ